MSPSLRMLRMRLSIPGLLRLGRSRGLPTTCGDLGYFAHCAMKELFGDDAPSPFRLGETRGRWLSLHAYTLRAKAELVEHAKAYADPVAAEAWDPESMAEKELPSDWAAGRQVGFEVRCCPVVRLSKEVRVPRGEGKSEFVVAAGTEVDAFLARAWRDSGPLDREFVYREWLATELGRRGGLAPLALRVTAMKRTSLLRRTHQSERKEHSSERPDVSFAGVGEIADSAGFSALLSRGVGRHRAFGFGMVILQPPARAC